MTEKRFTIAYETNDQYCIWWAVRDGDITLWKEEVVGLLNEQEQEISDLKKWLGIVPQMENTIKELKEENEELKKDLKKQFVPFARADENRITKVDTQEFINILQENEQLKSQLEKETDRVIKLEQYVYTKLCPKSENYDEEILSDILNAILGDSDD